MRRVIVVACLATLACGTPPPQETVFVTIPEGSSLQVIVDSLASTGVIESRGWFKLYVRLTGNQRALQAGTYELPAGASPRTVVRMMTSGRTAMERFVVAEGAMLSEIAQRAASIGIEPDSFLSAARDSDLLERVDSPGTTLEGYLYPSTYFVRVDAGASDVVRQMVGEFERRWEPDWNARAAELGFTRHEIVTLASIIEGEVRYDIDGPYVSSVYHNRLRRGMRLQADPTVIYALGTRRRLFERDYRYPSEYNTYLVDGLPPGPIGQPSQTSLHAALYPVETDFLFFVADTTGKHIFSRTYREHMGRVRELRRLWSQRSR